MKKASIYTCTGDQGQTSLIGGKRVSKASAQLEAYGTLDELNSQLGLLAAIIGHDSDDAKFVTQIQRELFKIGSILATPAGEAFAPLQPEILSTLERRIDADNAMLPPLRSFIIPGGCVAAATAHVCRTLCRRTERRIVSLSESMQFEPILLSYINRLSDYLFILSRKLNLELQFDEISL